MMRIAFLDPSGWDYDLGTPLREPMGGSESSLCYLAAELGRLGHAVTVYNGTAKDRDCEGASVRNLSAICNPQVLNSFDVVIVLNQAIGRELRERFRVSAPLVFWTQHAPDQPAVKPMIGRKECGAWTAIAYVSDWQRQAYEAYFQAPKEKGKVMRNAASPAFLAQKTPLAWFVAEQAPTLVYTSTPFRGLDVVLKAFPRIREATGATLRVFSGMSVYRAPDDPYRALYEQCQTMEGVDYVGPVGQSQLAAELSNAAALAYPSTFAETFCISAIEAMAVGAAVFSTRLGAIPETTGGLASVVAYGPDREALATRYAEMVIEELRDMVRNPRQAALARSERIQYVANHYTWPARAKEWADWLSGVTGFRPAVAAE